MPDERRTFALSMNEPIPSNPLILFDGVCNLCNRSVNFIIRRDPEALFRFAPLQGKLAEQKLRELSYTRQGTKSIILIWNGRIYERSGAALRIAGHLKGPVKCLYVFLAVPGFIRDAVYDIIANNRYRWFGKSDSCMVPTPELAKRFLND